MDTQLPEHEYAVVSCNGEKLLVIEQLREGVFVRAAKAGVRRRPNKFWPMWAHQQLLKADVKYQLKIEVQEGGVRVTSPTPLADWYWPVYGLLAVITRLPDPPMWRIFRNEGVRWCVRDDIDLSDIIRDLKLPAEVTRHYAVTGGSCGVYLSLRGKSKKRDRLFTPSQVAQMIELQVALACQDGWPTWWTTERRVLSRRQRMPQAGYVGPRLTAGMIRPIRTIELPDHDIS